MSIETIPGTQLRYYLVNFDKDGKERTDDPDGQMSACVQEAVRNEKPSDVFVFIHGWKGDIPAARKQYAAWMTSMMSLDADRAHALAKRPGFSPVLIGLHWPSLPFGDEELAPTVSFSTGGGDGLDGMVERCAEQIADTAQARAALRTIFAAALHDMAPATLPEDVSDAYRMLDRESGMAAAGVAGDPGADREAFDPEAAYAATRGDAASFGGGVMGGLLSPLVQLSFWKMKDRARKFGETGGFAFLSGLMNAGQGHDMRIHVMGHSFGCIAASASVAGRTGAKLPAAVHSLVLVQGALSLWSYCTSLPEAAAKQGYFRKLIDDRVVAGPIVTTQSIHDLAVGNLYPAAAGVAGQVAFEPGKLPKFGGVGSYGARGEGLDIVDLVAKSKDTAYGFEPGRIYNIECSAVIRDGDPPSGAHSDIARPEVAHLVWSAAI